MLIRIGKTIYQQLQILIISVQIEVLIEVITMAKRNMRLILEYDGSGYHGWQRQNEETTIQALIEEKIHVMTKESVKLIASGRTDAGVHAFCHVCNFITDSQIDPPSFKRGLNALLPNDIFIKQAEEVPIDFHSMYDAESKTYEYRILNQKAPNVFLRFYTWHIPQLLDREKMRACLSSLRGEHDFSSFKSTGSGNINPVRKMMRAEIHEPDKDLLYLVFEANGFLRHMVRNIVGTVVEVGRGKIGVDDFVAIFQAGDRAKAGLKAPPQGLFLTDVRYPANSCRVSDLT
jgi:tRNA pseudouridine38-40 synthase